MKAKLDDLTKRRIALEEQQTTSHKQLEEVTKDRDAIFATVAITERTKQEIQGRLDTAEATVVSLQQQVSHLSADLASHTRQLQDVRSDLAEATHRADDAEDAKRSLQTENSGLLAQLEEMRPKVIELSNKNAEDEERIWTMEKKIKSLESVVKKLERQMEERQSALEQSEARVVTLETEMKKAEEKHADELRILGESVSDTQQTHTSLAHDLANANATVRKLDGEVALLKQTVDHAKEETERWRADFQAKASEVDTVRKALEDSQTSEEDTIALVQRTQAEVDALRDQLALREDELTRLREQEGSTSSSPSRHHERQPSFNDELLSDLRQQHALDLSNAYSRIRELETAVFDAQASAHTFQRRVSSLEDDLTQLRSRSAVASPTRALHDVLDSSRLSMNSNRLLTPSTLRQVLIPRPVYEDNLPVETRHKRKVSLSMLKARIESERAAAAPFMNSPRTSLGRLPEGDESGSGARTPKSDSDGHASHTHSSRRVVDVLDEAHVFWCHSCHGDLVVL